MSDDEMRIAIAEFCGWRIMRPVINGCVLGRKDERKGWSLVPNYLGDLNAMHEAEKVFDDNIHDGGSLRYRYAHNLYFLCGKETQPMRATARQRAEAFIKTIKTK